MIVPVVARFVNRWIETPDDGALVPKSWVIVTVDSQIFMEVRYIQADDKMLGLWAGEQLARMRKRRP